MDSIGLVLFDSIKIRGGGGGEVCAHRVGAVGYTRSLLDPFGAKRKEESELTFPES